MRADDIVIPTPCHADWDAMRPEDRGRFCFDCRTSVHDLSAMTEPEAQRFLRDSAANDRRVCVSYQHDEAGTLVFREAPPAPVVPLSRLRRPRTAAAALMGATVAATLAACTPHGDPSTHLLVEESAAFDAPVVVIPHGEASESTPVPPPEAEVEDEPCDPVTETPTARDPADRKIRRTAGKPILRKQGEWGGNDPLAGL